MTAATVAVSVVCSWLGPLLVTRVPLEDLLIIALGSVVCTHCVR